MAEPRRALRGGPDAVCVRCSARPAVQAAEDRSGSPAGRESLGSVRWVWSASGTASRCLRGGGFARGKAALNAQPLHSNAAGSHNPAGSTGSTNTKTPKKRSNNALAVPGDESDPFPQHTGLCCDTPSSCS